MSVKLVQNSKNWNSVTEKWNHFVVVKSNVHYKLECSQPALWLNCIKVYIL